MSTLAMILTVAIMVPGDVPDKVPDEMEQETQRLDLRGIWVGKAIDQDKEFSVYLDKREIRILCWLGCVGYDHRIKDEGNGRLQMKEAGMLGIYRQTENRLIICVRDEEMGYPDSFQAINDQHLFILHRVKPRK